MIHGLRSRLVFAYEEIKMQAAKNAIAGITNMARADLGIRERTRICRSALTNILKPKAT
jgi:hypothetical protein